MDHKDSTENLKFRDQGTSLHYPSVVKRKICSVHWDLLLKAQTVTEV